ncbi:hypothetical protein ACFO0S_07165 [Chryseomicrobium palamuruense]|uniref:Uncharacterized protein n=1 Tax=Chryseomicrobium palamuruense TaxID=682973 RepID=A0ABV8UU82_9BACL
MNYALYYPEGYWTGKKVALGSSKLLFVKNSHDPNVRQFWFQWLAFRKASKIYSENKKLNHFEIIKIMR